MHFVAILRILGILLMVFSSAMLVSAAVSLGYRDGAVAAFALGFAVTFGSGALLWLVARNNRDDLSIRDGFLLVSLFWSVLGLFGALPFYLAAAPDVGFTDATFESISGLTTTGSTVLVGIETLPEGIRFYRQLLQWLGGIGIIVIAVAILPLLGVGGMQLYRAEIPGPIKNTKLTPRIAGTAKVLFVIYLALTVMCAMLYWLAGMSTFDAIGHAFSTVAIGGFSTYDASMGHFDNHAILIIASIFMLLAGINFAVHFYVWRLKSPSHYLKDPETGFYFGVLLVAVIIVCSYLALSGTYGPDDSLVIGIFQTISIATTTGYGATDFSAWPAFLPVLLIFLSFMGGCANSTGGGMKVVRIMLIAKQGFREMRQLVHPNAVIPLKIGTRRVEAKVVSAVWSFFAIYVLSFVIIMLLLMATGLDQVTAFSGTAATINNLGPGLGDVAEHYGAVSDFGKWVMVLAMLLGRLEIFTLLVIFTPTFWRR
jgi:trk system potassium uptake protein